MTSPKKLIIFFFAVLFINTLLQAQQSYYNGYIVNNNGDTTLGLLKKSSQIRLHKLCRFKPDIKSMHKDFSANDLVSYKFDGDGYFVSKEIIINGTTSRIFLEFLLEGEVDLYSYKDKDGIRFFIQTEADSLIELKNTLREIYTTKGIYHIYKNEYIEVLKSKLIDYPEIVDELNDIKYNYIDLIKVTKKYNNYICDDYQCVVYAKDVRIKSSLGMHFGRVNSKINFKIKDNIFNFLDAENFDFTTSFNLGLIYSITNMFGSNNNMSMNFSLDLMSNKYVSQNISIKQESISLPIYIKYSFPTGNLHPFINVGFRNTFFLYKNVEVSNNEYSEIENDYLSYLLEESIGKYQISTITGVGLEYKRNKFALMIQSSYEIGSGIIKSGNIYNNYLSSISQFVMIDLGVKYDLN